MSNGIITNTLPTLVAMGVVSRAVDTTMGHHQSRTAPRKRSKVAYHRNKKWEYKVFKGPRGGRYIIKKGRKVYI